MRRQTRFANLVLTLLYTALLGTANLAHGASAAEIEARSDAAMERLLDSAPEARFLLDRAHAVLIFPRVLKAGFGVGGNMEKAYCARTASRSSTTRLPPLPSAFSLARKPRHSFFCS